MARTALRVLVVTAGVATLSLAVVACGGSSTKSSSSPAAASAQRTIAYSRVVDLSHVVSPKIPLMARRSPRHLHGRGDHGQGWLLPA